MPSSPVAMPRAYWEDTPHDQLSDQIILIEPSAFEFSRIEDAINNAGNNVFDMDIVSDMYFDSALVMPHRRYDLLTGELRRSDGHVAYLGNDLEEWDVDKIMAEAKFLHFSDWPVPKPWISRGDGIMTQHQPACVDRDGQQDCHERDLWLGFYHDFAQRRKRICGLDLSGGGETILDEDVPTADPRYRRREMTAYD